MALSAGSETKSFLPAIGLISEKQQRALRDMLGLLLPEGMSLPTTMESLHKVTQDYLIRPREIKGEFKPGLLKDNWVRVIEGPKGERSGCQDAEKLQALRGAIEEYAKIFGFYDPLAVADGMTLKGVRVLSTGAMYARVCLRMRCAQALIDQGVVENGQIYFSGSARELFDAEKAELADEGIVLSAATEAEMVKYVAKENGFLEENFVSAVAKINAPRATTEDEGRALAADNAGAPILVVSNAPFARRQTLDIFKALLQDTKVVPVVIAIGDGCTPKTPLFTIIEELTYWVNTAKAIIEWTQANQPELREQVSLAMADIMNMGKPGYVFQSEAYQKAFSEGMPITERPVMPVDISIWRHLGGKLAEVVEPVSVR
jgi:hypothetical protein